MTNDVVQGGSLQVNSNSGDRIPVAGPWVTELEAKYVADAATNDWYKQAGQSVGKFEQEFAAYLGVRFAAAVPHCTSALHLAMLALDIGPGDEVIVPESTWVATAVPITYLGAEPVFADIDKQTWQLSAESLAKHLSPRTKAIVTVDLYGGVPDMDAINALVKPRGIPVIEDAAQSIGSSYAGRPAGTLGSIGTFSFHGTKTLTTGEGGMLVTDRADLFERVARMRDHGRTATDFKFFVTSEIGYKYRMSSLQAAFGRAQLTRLGELLDRKRQIYEWYEARLADIPGIQLNQRQPNIHNTFWMVTVVVDPGYKLSTRQMMALFDKEQIDSRPFFPPLSSLPAFGKYASARSARASNSIAYDLAERTINLPSALLLTENQVDRVCKVFRTMLNNSKVNSK